MKQYVGISRDHSGSMAGLTKSAMNDYNENLHAIKKAADKEDMDTLLSTVICDSTVSRETVLASVSKVRKIDTYRAHGSTPLFDSVGELIEIMESVPDAKDPATHFLVMAITDGYENSSRKWSASSLADKIRKLQATDQWTFTFRVPRGYKHSLARLGIPEANILEWDQTEAGLQEATRDTVVATSNYFSRSAQASSAGRSFSSQSYYADLSGVDKKAVAGVMTNISAEVRIWPVSRSTQIRDFCEYRLGDSNGKAGLFSLGAAFYQLSKPEKAVQDYKMIVIRNKKDGAVYAGKSARDLLGIPSTGTIKLAPGDHGDWDIYIQSTSTNRKLSPGTNVLYWDAAGKANRGRATW